MRLLGGGGTTGCVCGWDRLGAGRIISGEGGPIEVSVMAGGCTGRRKGGCASA